MILPVLSVTVVVVEPSEFVIVVVVSAAVLALDVPPALPPDPIPALAPFLPPAAPETVDGKAAPIPTPEIAVIAPILLPRPCCTGRSEQNVKRLASEVFRPEGRTPADDLAGDHEYTATGLMDGRRMLRRRSDMRLDDFEADDTRDRKSTRLNSSQ